jgi:hypothetical protein
MITNSGKYINNIMDKILLYYIEILLFGQNFKDNKEKDNKKFENIEVYQL